jgi:hypothetical protein
MIAILTATVNVIKLAKSSKIKGDALANKTVLWASFGMVNADENAPVIQVAQMTPIKSKACASIHRPGPNFILVPKTSMCMELSAKTGICAVQSKNNKILLLNFIKKILG